MAMKNRRKEASALTKRRADTYRKKILRDSREFYRILFRTRFPRNDYGTPKGIQKCMRIFFKDLGMTVSEEDLCDPELYLFLHQTHLGAQPEKAEEDLSPFEAVGKYNDVRFLRFLKHPICAQMLYFLFSNFMEEYSPFLKSSVRDKILDIIQDILTRYRKCRIPSDLENLEIKFG